MTNLCELRMDDRGDWICDRCKSLWTEMLDETGWLPPECRRHPLRSNHEVKDQANG